jgi:ABC-type lipoprotein export system ATPase subunit
MVSSLMELIDVSKRFRAVQAGSELDVLRSISLRVAAGESLAIVGPSGSGKSTLLNIMGTLDHPTSGQVLLGGQDLAKLDEARLAVVRNEQIGFIFQAHHLLPQCTALENVLVPTLAGARRDLTARARELLKRVGLEARTDHFPGQLSGGERQRVAVVRALINSPKLLLADEPTGALDHAAASELGQLLVDLNREEQVSLVVVTHATELAQRMGRRLELRDGKLM